jgi:hypothetical protein
MARNRLQSEKRLPVTRYVSKYFPPTVDAGTVDWEHFQRRYDEVQHLMRTEHAWFEDGHNYGFRPATSRDIALGRMQFYVQFADFLYEKYGKRFYLLDYMTRLEGVNGLQSLAYYIDTAEEIHINLEGVSAEKLRRSTTSSMAMGWTESGFTPAPRSGAARHSEQWAAAFLCGGYQAT